MDCQEIILGYLEEKGYAGLFNIDGECACAAGDLVPCDGIEGSCRPGYKAPCDCGDHDYHIIGDKEEARLRCRVDEMDGALETADEAIAEALTGQILPCDHRASLKGALVDVRKARDF